MYKIKLLLSFFLISLINVLNADNNTVNHSIETYKILRSVSKLYNYNLNREILFDKKIVEKIYLNTTYYSFCNSLYKNFEPVDIKNIISEDDIIELHKRVRATIADKKWNRKMLKRNNIPTTRDIINYQKPKSLYQTSPPIFFKDSSFSIIYIRQYCGPECGERTIKIFRKNDLGIWEYFGEIFIGIS